MNPEIPEQNTALNRKTIVVCLEEEVYSPVSYLRVIRHLQDLHGDYRVSVFVLPRQLPEALECIPSAALLLMARNRHESSFLAARKAAECSVPILCDIDDYVWEFPDYSKVERHPRIYTDEILALAAAVSTPSEDLARLVRDKHPGKDVRILPNPGNVWSDAAPAFTSGVMANSDFFRMPEMKADFFRALRDAAQEARRPLLLHYFSNDPPEPFSDDPHLRILWMGFRSYSSYKQLLHHLRPAFGFVLLRDERFSRHKSVVKFAEFAFAGAIGLYSRVEPYLGFVEDGRNGFLADNTYESWRQTTLRALRLPPHDLRAMQQCVAAEANEKFDFRRIHADFRQMLDQYAAPAPSPADAPFAPNLPPLGDFQFREAYAYAAWVMHAERHRLERALADATQPFLRRLLKRALAPFLRR
jgi:hypothetical protein